MAKIEIRNRFDGRVLFAHEAENNTIRLTVEAAVTASVDLVEAHLAGANLVGASLDGAILDRASLVGANLAGASLVEASLDGASLVGASLDGASLDGASLGRASLVGASLAGANLDGAHLDGANLAGANLRSLNVPVVTHIDAAILRAVETAGSTLDMRVWHTCETTHCRAGWAIVLAGKTGAELEARFGPGAAGALIYAASRPTQRVPDFVASDADALADLRACAAADPLPA